MTRILTLAALAAAFHAAPAAAQSLTLSYGATVTSNYVSRGFTQSNGWAFQPWVEVETAQGWYAGLWASTVDLGTDRAELDVYAGYRWAVGNTAFDLSYLRVYMDDTGDAGGEIGFAVEHDLGRVVLSGALAVGHAGSLTMNDAHAGMAYAINDRLSASGTVGIAGGSGYGDLGLTYALRDSVELDARLHGGDGIGHRLVLSAGVAF